MRRFIVTSIILLFGVFMPAVGVYAEGEDSETSEETTEDTTYEGYVGELDIYTGEPVGSEANVASASNIVTIDSNVTYDLTNQMFNYASQNGVFSCSAADGMYVTGTVNMAVSGEYNIALYKDGTKMDSIPTSVSEPGSYVAVVWDDNSENQICAFTIVTNDTGAITQYIMPDGFNVTRVIKDGQEIRTGRGSVDMTEEGYYEISYQCYLTQIDYYLTVNVDHTPPNVKFVGIDDKDHARGPVTLEGVQDDDTVYVSFNEGTPKVTTDYELTESGDYLVMIIDKAGNVQQQELTIFTYLNIKAVAFLLIVLALIIGIGVALYISRKKLRVR